MMFWRWFRTLISGRPHFVVGNPAAPYMLRWWIIPRNRVLNVYLHKFLRDDDDRARHDHPWRSLSILLRGELEEDMDGHQHGLLHGTWVRPLGPGSIVYRTAEHRHIIRVKRGPAWTLFMTGAIVRRWGFWCPQGFVDWEKFTAPGATGQIGRGCDQ